MIKLNELVNNIIYTPRPDRRGISKIVKGIYHQGRLDERERIFRMTRMDKKLPKI